MSPPSVEPLSRTIAWWLFAGAMLAFFTLSSPALYDLGIPYDAPFGPPFAKIHPGTFVLILALFFALSSHGNPLGSFLRVARAEPLMSFFFVSIILLFAWTVTTQGTSGAAYIIQTFWVPPLAVYTLRLLKTERARQTVLLLMGLLALNSAIALGEYFMKKRLIPVPLEELQYFRASALLGHPLLNASVTTALLPGVTLLPVRLWAKGALALLMLCSILAYGARTALASTLLIYGLPLLAYVAYQAAHGRYNYRQLTGGVVAVAAIVGALAIVVASTGLGDRIFENLVWDNSANVRAKSLQALDYLRGSEWFLGVPPARVADIELRMGLDPNYEAIENFWIAAFLQFGLIGYVIFLAALGSLTVWMVRRATPAFQLAILLFFLVASTSNSLTSKTVSITFLVVVVGASKKMSRRPGARITRPLPARSRVRLRMPVLR